MDILTLDMIDLIYVLLSLVTVYFGVIVIIAVLVIGLVARFMWKNGRKEFAYMKNMWKGDK